MRRWVAGITIALVVLIAAAAVVAWYCAKRFQPFVHEQAVRYLEQRFGSQAKLARLRISAPFDSPLAIARTPLRISGEGLVLPYRDRVDLPPLIRVRRFEVEAALGALWQSPRRIGQVRLEGLEINIPPKRLRQASGATAGNLSRAQEAKGISGAMAVLVDTVYAADTLLRIYPDNPAKPPREFEIHQLRLHGAGTGRPLHYTGSLTNWKPRGLIDTSGEFGPWQRDDPGASPLSGRYVFRNADLGTIHGIAGILESTGKFEGVLERIEVRGETRTPDFRLALSGNRVPLTTEFHSIVDGTSGDTLLRPVRAILGRTRFVANGGVVRPEGARARSISLDVLMQNGRIEDLLRLATKARTPVMVGEITLRTRLQILPREIATVEKLLLDGSFNVEKTHFNADGVQDKIDVLSRRAQGQPKNQQIEDVLSAIRGAFLLREGEITFSDLSFRVPGADIDLKGRYGLENERIEMRGTARLQAKVSQTMTGWKRWFLKPADPFFSKHGAGTYLPIRVTGTREKPEFGLDRGKGDTKQNPEEGRQASRRADRGYPTQKLAPQPPRNGTTANF
ncbi:MAG: hypothetical protein HYZ57_09955 [Acidobacteria bacterium]|nr:hypothetical protein [Acidobacteriota bacterium]MBI3280151.1 hypothetical protein [Acidobacteriota bacterium]